MARAGKYFKESKQERKIPDIQYPVLNGATYGRGWLEHRHIITRMRNEMFIQQIFMEHLLCAKDQIYKSEQECHDSSGGEYKLLNRLVCVWGGEW